MRQGNTAKVEETFPKPICPRGKNKLNLCASNSFCDLVC